MDTDELRQITRTNGKFARAVTSRKHDSARLLKQFERVPSQSSRGCASQTAAMLGNTFGSHAGLEAARSCMEQKQQAGFVGGVRRAKGRVQRRRAAIIGRWRLGNERLLRVGPAGELQKEARVPGSVMSVRLLGWYKRLQGSRWAPSAAGSERLVHLGPWPPLIAGVCMTGCQRCRLSLSTLLLGQPTRDCA